MDFDHSNPINSSGIIPVSKDSGEWRVFLIQYRGYEQYWGCPKGHIEPGEAPLQAARRELMEETGLEIKKLLHDCPILEEFWWMKNEERQLKRVLFFIAEVDGQVLLQKNEISDGRWFTFPDAIKQIVHPEGKTTLKQVEQIFV